MIFTRWRRCSPEVPTQAREWARLFNEAFLRCRDRVGLAQPSERADEAELAIIR